uniref:Uncharacterized protein n=1 Tax=Magallana gigas TaxID=29159 RepID=A0A8W8LPM1_MAGGI
MAEMTELRNIKEKSQNPDAVLRELYICKVTANEKSVKKYTGLPMKSMLDGRYVLEWSRQCSGIQLSAEPKDKEDMTF